MRIVPCFGLRVSSYCYPAKKQDTVKSKHQLNLSNDTVSFSAKKQRSPERQLLELAADAFPSEGLREFMLEELNKTDNDKNVLELHRQYYSQLLDCTSLEEAKMLYPELKDVIDAKDIDISKLGNSSIFRKVANGKVEGLTTENMTLKFLQQYYAKFTTLRNRDEFFGLSDGAVSHILTKLNMTMDKRYFNIICCQKHVDTGIKNYQNPDFQKGLIDATVKRWQNPLEKEKMSKKSRERWEDKEYKDRVTRTLQEVGRTPEFRAKSSANVTRLWQNEEFIAHQMQMRQDADVRKRISTGVKKTNETIEQKARNEIVDKSRIEAWKRHPEISQIFSDILHDEYPRMGAIIEKEKKGITLSDEEEICRSLYFKRCNEVCPEANDIIAKTQKDILREWGYYDTPFLYKKEKKFLLSEIRKAKRENAPFQEGSLGRVYKIYIPTRTYPLAVKEFQSTDEGRNPQKEAESLRKLPFDCKRVQKFLGIVEDNSTQYLVTTYLEGEPLSNYKENMSDELIGNILDELFKIDRHGEVYYDFGMANIVVDKDEPRFFDFETLKKQSFTRQNTSIASDLCHQARNPYFLKISNLSAFEIRTIGKIIAELEKYPDGEKRSSLFVERYLRQLSQFYQNTSELYKESLEKENTEMSEAAYNYEKILSEIFKNPINEVVEIEKQLMRLKELLVEYHFRNDPDLDNDERLYSNITAFVKNLRERFSKVQGDINNLQSNSSDEKIKEYCMVTSDFLHRLENQEVDNYLAKKQ